MRFAHMADLHIGKKLQAFDRLDEQRDALFDAIDIISRENVDCVFLAGDIYDRSVPSAEAVALADEFLTSLAKVANVYCVSGNHDSPERLAFGRRLMRKNGVYISGAYEGRIDRFEVEDEYGRVTIWMLPFVRPREVEQFFENASFQSADEAVEAILKRDMPNAATRNIMVTHQFVTSASSSPLLSESEVNPVGGLSEVRAELFSKYDYTALGHLHAPQRVGESNVRYAGSLLKYSFSEARHVKSLTIGEMGADGGVTINLCPIPAKRDLRVLKGALDKLVEAAKTSGLNADDYVSITLTDACETVSPMDALSAAYPNIARLELPVKGENALGGAVGADERKPAELFADFYKTTTGSPLTNEMSDIVNAALAEAFENA